MLIQVSNDGQIEQASALATYIGTITGFGEVTKVEIPVTYDDDPSFDMEITSTYSPFRSLIEDSPYLSADMLQTLLDLRVMFRGYLLKPASIRPQVYYERPGKPDRRAERVYVLSILFCRVQQTSTDVGSDLSPEGVRDLAVELLAKQIRQYRMLADNETLSGQGHAAANFASLADNYDEVLGKLQAQARGVTDAA